MNKTTVLKYLALVGKVTGLVGGLGAIPFIDPAKGVLIFAAASILKDVVNRVGDYLDDGIENKSFRAE
jgi:hypothetical protein